MSETQARPNWVRLGRELKRLREFAGLTQRDMAAVVKVTQTTIGRIEKGGPKGKPPAWPKVREWAEAAASANPDLEDLREMAEAALDEHLLYRNLMGQGLAAVQDDIGAMEAAALTLRYFSSWGIPGLLQTPEYARRTLAMTDYRHRGGIEAAVEARMRRQEILRDGKHQIEFVMPESGLRWRPGPVPVMVAQLAQVAEMAALASVTLSVIPSGITAHAAPLCGFVIYEDLVGGEDPSVAVELYHRLVTTSKPEDVAIYRDQYDLLRRSAVQGDEAQHVIQRAIESLH